MASKLTFLTDNLLDKAALSLVSGTQNYQFPISNIKLAFTTKVFRSNEDFVELLIDLQTTSPVDTFAICGDSLNGGLGFNGATLRGSGSLDFSGSTVHSIDLSQEYGFGFKYFTSESHRYWLLTLDASVYVEISNFFIGSRNELVDNDISATSFEWAEIDRSTIQENRYAQKFINEYNVQQSLAGNINLISGEQVGLLREISTRHGKRKPVWFLLDPLNEMGIENSHYLFSGFFYFGTDFKWKTITKNYFSVSINLEEVV